METPASNRRNLLKAAGAGAAEHTDLDLDLDLDLQSSQMVAPLSEKSLSVL